MHRLVLGTAQFGLDYGINNSSGKIPSEEALPILNQAIKLGIDSLDTARGYGESEQIVGNFIRQTKEKIKIISKLPNCHASEVESVVDLSLKTLNIEQFYGYLVHDYDHYIENPEIWDELKKLKDKGKIKKIGFSLYYPKQLENILEKHQIDIVQIPYNIFDQRFEAQLEMLKERGIESFIRSVFLQGLVFKRSSSLHPFFNNLKGRIDLLNSIAEKNKVPIEAICLNFALTNRFVDKVIIGIDNAEHLKKLVVSLNYYKNIESLKETLLEFKEDDENLILPFLWKCN